MAQLGPRRVRTVPVAVIPIRATDRARPGLRKKTADAFDPFFDHLRPGGER